MNDQNTSLPDEILIELLSENKPNAYADIAGNAENPQLNGTVKLYDTPYGGVLVEAEIFGLPDSPTLYASSFYGFHIHEKGNCKNSFNKTGNHYNPYQKEHPDHAGDLPPLLGNQGFAYSVFYTQRFTLSEIVGKSIVIHSMPDDFTTQPSGNSGTKIGCGVIEQA